MTKENLPRIKKPWPTDRVMNQVYAQNLWGSNDSPFYSGDGSHDAEMVDPYLETVKQFLCSFETPLVVCDLGCGDFNIGKDLVPYSLEYHAVDIVPSLIEFNQSNFAIKNLKFYCRDIAKDDLPSGDCAILRQVLQHLSNAEVKKIVQKLYQYKYLIVTEHIPRGDFVSNKDILSGQGIRLKKQSGIDLLARPFNFKVKSERQLISTELPNGKGVIVTTLYEV